jgi:FkbM family methyltransferase
MNFASTISRLPRFFRRQRLINLLLRVSPSSRVQLISLPDGTRFYADLRQPLSRNILAAGSIDPEYLQVASVFLSASNAEPVMFDIGANYGIYSFVFLPRFPNVKLHQFDANPNLCDFLRRTAELYPGRGVRIVNACVTEKSGGHSMLRLDTHNDGASHISESGDFQVPNVSLGDHVRENGIDEIAFAKMDVEGFEVNALKGLLAEGLEGRLKALVFEVVNEHLERAGTRTEELFALLEAKGYRLFHFRKADFEVPKWSSFQVDKARQASWNLKGRQLTLAPLDRERAAREKWNFGTDLLAVHQSVPMHQA